MNFFDFFKKKEETKKQKSTILLAMPIFKNGDRYKIADVIESLKSEWNLNIEDFNGDDDVATFNIDGEIMALAFMDIPIPWGDIEGTAKYAYNWPTAAKDLKDHTGHAIVSIMSGSGTRLEKSIILSKALCAVLTGSNAVAVYQGNQSLLIPREQYLSHVEELQENGAPIALWVYIGLRKTSRGNSAYTYGLKDFQKKEFEIINSKLGLEELYEFLYNGSAYVVDNDISLTEGETIGPTPEQKILIKSSKGEFVEGYSIKLDI